MIIRQDQSAYLGKLAFIRKIRDLLRDQFPGTRNAPVPELDREIYRQVETAARYGLLSEHAAATYVITAWLLGPRFDQEFPAVREHLEEVRSPEAHKVLWLQTFSMTLLSALEKEAAGEDQHVAG